MSSTPGTLASLRVAAAIVALETVALLVVAVVAVTRALDGSAQASFAIALAVLAGALGAVLGAGAWAMAKGRTWPRGIVMTWQLLQIAAGVAVLELSREAGLAAIVLGAVTAAAVVLDVRARPSV